MKTRLLLAALALSSAAHAAPDSDWWIVEQRGECHSLEGVFPGAKTPEQAHTGLTKRGGGPTMKRISQNVMMFEDPFRNYPPLLMVKGWDRCLRVERSLEEQRSLKIGQE